MGKSGNGLSHMDDFHHKWGMFIKNFGIYHDQYMKSHHSIMNFISQLQCKSTPNVLMISRKGFPLDLLLKEGLRRAFQLDKMPSADQSELYEDEIPYKHCQYFFELDFEHPDMPKDCSNIVNLIKSVASTRSILGERHIWILKNIEKIRRGFGLEPFRVLLERFSANAIFLCISTQPSAMDISLRSRFIYLRVPLLSIKEIHAILNEIQCDPIKIKKVQTKNLLTAFCIASLNEPSESWSVLHYPPVTEIKSWTIDTIRKLAHEYCMHGISLSNACMDILYLLPPKKSRSEAVELFARLEHKFVQGSRIREMWYIELAFVGIFITPVPI